MNFLVEVIGRLANPVHPEKTLEDLGKLAADLHRSARPREAPKPSPRSADLSAGDKANLVAAYRDGRSSGALAKDYGIGKGTVLGLLDEHAVTKRRQPPGTEVLERATDLYKEGLPLATISSQLGVPQSTLRRHLHKQGIVLRPRGGSKPRTD